MRPFLEAELAAKFLEKAAEADAADVW